MVNPFKNALHYFSSNKVYRVYNNRTIYLEDPIHVAFEKTQNNKIVEILDDIIKVFNI